MTTRDEEQSLLNYDTNVSVTYGTAESEKFGKKYDYDASWLGPLREQRNPTDVPYLKLLTTFCFVWLGVLACSNIDFCGGDAATTNDDGLLELYLTTLMRNRSTVFRMMGLSVCLCVAYIVLLRWLAKVFSYIFVLLFVIFELYIIFYGSVWALQTDRLHLFIRCGFGTIILVTFVIYVIAYRETIDFVCNVIEETCGAVVMFFPSSLVFPLIPLAVLFTITVFSAITFMNLLSISKNCDGTPSYLVIIHVYNLFGLLWLGSILEAFSRTVLAGTFSTWYWSQNEAQIPSFSLVRFMGITIKYHLGTLAFGSLVIIPCKLALTSLNFVKKLLSDDCCPLACITCYQRIKSMEYVDYDAYITSAIHGTSFIQSARDAFNLTKRNLCVIYNATRAMIGITLFFGQFFIVCFSVLTAWMISDDDSSVLIGAVFVSSAVITFFFFMVVRVAVDTMFLSLLEDCERNDGSSARSRKLQCLVLIFSLNSESVISNF